MKRDRFRPIKIGILVTTASILASPARCSNVALSGPLELDFAYGQSLVVGTHGCPALTTTPPLPTQVFMLNDLYKVGGTRLHRPDDFKPFNNPGITDIVPAKEAEAPSPITANEYCETGVVAMLAQRAFLGAKTKFVGRSDGAGAENAPGLGPGSNPYQNMVGEFQTLTALAKQRGGSVTIGAILLNQGQTDRIQNTLPADYVATWRQTIDQFAADTQQNPIWYIAQLSASGVGNGIASPVSQAQYDLSVGKSPIPSARLCFPQYVIPTTPVDGLHFDASGYILQGEYIGKCMQNRNWRPLYPVLIGFGTADRSIINTVWSVPVPPIRFDPADVIQGPAYDHGFRFVDDCTKSQATPYTTVKSVTITGANHVLIKLTVPWNSACANPTLQNAYDGPVLASSRTLPKVARPGGGGTPGSDCVLSASFDPGSAEGQARYAATVSASGGLVSIDRLVSPGLYPNRDLGDFNQVPLFGCGLTGAAVNGLKLRQWNDSLTMTAAWSDLADSDTSISRTGRKLIDYAVVFSLPVAVPASRGNLH